jgi:hypothetical protein
LAGSSIALPSERGFLDAFSRAPRLATSVLWAASRDEAMVVEHLVDLGRRPSRSGIITLLTFPAAGHIPGHIDHQIEDRVFHWKRVASLVWPTLGSARHPTKSLE